MTQPVPHPLSLFFIIFLAMASILLPVHSTAEVPPSSAVEASTRKIENLSSLIATIEQVKTEVVEAQKALSSPTALGKEGWYRTRIDILTTRLTALEKGFEQLATGVEKSNDSPGGSNPVFEWNNELKELFAPMIKEMKRMTARPREIQGLHDELEAYEEELKQVHQALASIAQLTATPELPLDLPGHLRGLESKWRHRKQELTSLKGLTELKLEEKEAGKRSISGSLQNFTRLFFKSRGRNLLMAIGVLFSILFVMTKMRNFIVDHSKLYERAQTIYARVFDLTYMIITVIAALLATMGTLYLVNDWVLLSIFLIFVVGLLWASKEGVPRMWSQIRLLLNLGAVREGERILYQGVPYRVVAINLYSELENKALQGGRVRLPLKDLFTLRSRLCHPDEPWFPTQRRDWVLLSDGTHGEVTIQSPEFIGLRLLGGATQQIPPATFLTMNPTNLSHGFRIESRFRLAATHKADATSTLPSQLKAHLSQRFSTTAWHPKFLTVLYRRTLPSFLELSILVDFPGTCAKDHPIITMALEQFCLEAAETLHWDLPTHRLAVNIQGESPTNRS